MQQAGPSKSVERLRERLVFHGAALEASESLPEGLAATRALSLRCREWIHAQEDRRERVLVAQARRELADDAADRAIRHLEVDAAALVMRDTKDERYARLFGRVSMGELVRLPIPEQIEQMKVLEQSLTSASGSELSTKHAGPLREARERLDATQAAHREAALHYGAHFGEAQILRADVGRLLLRNYADLRAQTPHDLRRVEAHFLAFTRVRAAEDEPEGEQT